MTTTNAQAVLDRLETDEAFAKRVRDAGGAEASLALLRAEGFEVSGGEMRDATLDRYEDALTTDQLDALAGGVETQAVMDGIAIGVISAGVATGAAAGAAAAV